MATTMTPFTSDKSDGTLPNTQHATRFQYSHYINWDTIQTWGAGLGKEGKGTWHIQLIDPSGTVIFEQTVTITITVIFFFFELVWYYYDTVGEVFNTTIIGGEPVTPQSPSASYTIGGVPFGEEGNMIPGGADVPAFNSEGIVSATWFSPVYIMDVPVGTKLHVITDNWNLGVQVRPEWQWSFLYGGNAAASLFDETTGMDWQAFSDNINTTAINTRQMRFGTLAENIDSFYPSPAQYTAIFRIGPSVFVVADIGGLRLFETRDEGLTWSRPMEFFQDITVLAACPSRDGGQIFIYGQANTATTAWAKNDVVYLIAHRDGETWKVRASGKVATADMPTQKLSGMNFAGGALILSANNNPTMNMYQSTDEMVNWKPVVLS